MKICIVQDSSFSGVFQVCIIGKDFDDCQRFVHGLLLTTIYIVEDSVIIVQDYYF